MMGRNEQNKIHSSGYTSIKVKSFLTNDKSMFEKLGAKNGRKTFSKLVLFQMSCLKSIDVSINEPYRRYKVIKLFKYK